MPASPSPTPSPAPCIGVFDSGVGGLSVLNAMHRRLPHASLTYVGDVAFAPYGERAPDEVVARCDRIVAHLVHEGARTIVIACNTATVLGIEALRQRWPGVAFVGVEPGVKPAAARTRSRRIAIMTTTATARSARLRHLVNEYAEGVHVHIEACPGLATAIERGLADGPELHAVLAPLCHNLRAADVDTVVLGCTHYPFVASAIQALLGAHITLVDTASAVADRVAFVAGESLVRPGPAHTRLRVLSTGATGPMSALLERCDALAHARVERLAL